MKNLAQAAYSGGESVLASYKRLVMEPELLTSVKTIVSLLLLSKQLLKLPDRRRILALLPLGTFLRQPRILLKGTLAYQVTCYLQRLRSTYPSLLPRVISVAPTMIHRYYAVDLTSSLSDTI
jgi:hypothetical protein